MTTLAADKLEWLRNLKAGDRFARVMPNYPRGTYIYRVDRVTPAQIIVQLSGTATLRVCRKTARVIGSDSWNEIMPVTPAIELECFRRDTLAMIQSVATGRKILTDEQLRAVRVVLDPAIDQARAVLEKAAKGGAQ